MAVFDCTMFFNENDILEVRINEHWDHVDKFIIIEAEETHTGLPKPLNFDHERFAPYKSKIEYRAIKNFHDAMLEFPEINCSIGRREHNNHLDWARDHFQWNYTYTVLQELGADDYDIVYFSCLDEIFKPMAFEKAKDILLNNKTSHTAYNWTNHSVIDRDLLPCIAFNMYMYAFKINLLRFSPSNNYISGAITFVKNFKKFLPATLRTCAIVTHDHIHDGGWHFSYIDSTDGEFIVKKYKSWAHANDDINGFRRSYIDDPMDALKFMLNEFDMSLERSVVPIAKGTHPDYIVNNLDKFDLMIYKN